MKVIALNTLIDPQHIYRAVHKEIHPVIVIENKLDYGRKIATKKINNFIFEKSDQQYPLVRIRPQIADPTITIVTYGGMVHTVLNCIEPIFFELDLKAEVFVLTQIHPLHLDEIIHSVNNTQLLVTIEEGSSFAGIGSEIIASIREKTSKNFRAKRITSLPAPIASAKTLETALLPNQHQILNNIRELLA